MSFVDIQVVQEPLEEPVTLEEVKRNLRIDEVNTNLYLTDEDIQRKAIAARKRCEKFTRRSLISQNLDVWYDKHMWAGYFELPRGPVQAVVSIKTYDDYNVETLVDSGTYDLIGGMELLMREWLPYYRPSRGIVIRIRSGYGDYPENVPADLREGIIEYATYLCDNPAGEGPEIKYQAQVTGVGLPPGVMDKWKPYRLEMA